MADDSYKPGSLPYPEQDDRKLFCKFHYKGVLIILIPLLFAPILFWNQLLPSRMLFVSICVYLYYIFNVMAQGAIAFIFIVLLPVFGITASKVICMSQYTDLVFTTFGCVFLGIMLEASRLNERMGMLVIRCCGTKIRMMVFLLMALAMVTSIFSNSAFAAAVWMKVAQAAVAELGKAGVITVDSEEETYERQSAPYPTSAVVGIYLSVAYGSTLGAMVSPFQNPNSAIVKTLTEDTTVKLPYMLFIFLGPMLGGFFIIFLWLNLIYLGLFWGSAKAEIKAAEEGGDNMKQAMADKKTEMGPLTVHTITAAIITFIVFILLLTRLPLFFIGWDDVLLKECGASVPLIFACVCGFSIAANYMFCRYYCCQKPGAEGTTPSVIGWKLANKNTPWAHIFMMTAGLAFVGGYANSNLMGTVTGNILDGKYGKASCFFIGTLLSILLTNLSSGEALAQVTLKSMVAVTGGLGVGFNSLAVPYIANIHNKFLLPMCCASNTIVAGWGNLRPFQFLLGGCVPSLIMILFFYLSIQSVGDKAFPDAA